MKDKTTITVNFNGTVLQYNISRNTTCDDVIKMATINNISPQNGINSFAVFETAFGVQKILPRQTKLLKQVRSWGVDSHNFSLEVREVDIVKSKMTSISRAKAKLQRLRSLIMKHELKTGEKFETDLHDNLASNAVNKVNKYSDKNITTTGQPAKRPNSQVQPEVIGKKELLKRYLTDSVENNYYNGVQLPVRTRGIVRETDAVIESEFLERTRGDGEDSISYDTESDGEQIMNKAFMISETFTENISYNGNDELNECILYDTDETSSDYEESAFEDDSDYGSVCELERNIIESYAENTYTQINELKRIFSNGDLNARITEDDLLDSFMNTFVHDEDSDEGMSSVNNDFE